MPPTYHHSTAVLRADELRDEAKDEALPYRTPRRSRSAHYGVVRNALAYILHVHGVSHAAPPLVRSREASRAVRAALIASGDEEAARSLLFLSPFADEAGSHQSERRAEARADGSECAVLH